MALVGGFLTLLIALLALLVGLAHWGTRGLDDQGEPFVDRENEQ